MNLGESISYQVVDYKWLKQEYGDYINTTTPSNTDICITYKDLKSYADGNYTEDVDYNTAPKKLCIKKYKHRTIAENYTDNQVVLRSDLYIVGKDPDPISEDNIITVKFYLSDINKTTGSILQTISKNQLKETPTEIYISSNSGTYYNNINASKIKLATISLDDMSEVTGTIATRTGGYNTFYGLTIKEDYIMNNCIYMYFKYAVNTTLPNSAFYNNEDIGLIYLPQPYTTADNACVWYNPKLKTIIVADSIQYCVSDCFAALPALENIYIGSSTAPALSKDDSYGFTFIDVTRATDDTPKVIICNSNVKIHVPSYATGYDADSTDVWKWPGCIKSTSTGTDGMSDNVTLYNREKLDTWTIVKDYDTIDISKLVY